jgi:hypothetical protein
MSHWRCPGCGTLRANSETEVCGLCGAMSASNARAVEPVLTRTPPPASGHAKSRVADSSRPVVTVRMRTRHGPTVTGTPEPTPMLGARSGDIESNSSGGDSPTATQSWPLEISKWANRVGRRRLDVGAGVAVTLGIITGYFFLGLLIGGALLASSRPIEVPTQITSMVTWSQTKWSDFTNSRRSKAPGSTTTGALAQEGLADGDAGLAEK